MRRFPRLLAGLALAVPLLPLRAQREVPTPLEVFGHEVGDDYFLASYTQLREYWERVAAASDRMELEEIGTTSYGLPMLMAVISSPQNLARREEYRDIARRLCLARGVSPGEARELAQRGRAVVWIDAGMHATECVAGQNILELVHRMTVSDDPEVLRILDAVILLVCPANPDGMEMIANAYMATRKVGSIPVLYQRWVGHDNNRDFYMSTMPETKAINRVLYRRWFPQIVYNHHQTAPRGTVIFTPPFRDPFNYWIDPMVMRGIEMTAAHMNQRFAREGKAGVISRAGANYSTWWNGGLRTTSYFHNMIGILTESFGSPNPTELEQTLVRRLPSGDYPMPVASQEWHARQTIEYLQTANFAILDLAARYREELLHDIWTMGQRAIARGRGDHWTPTPRLVAEARRRDEERRNAEPRSAEGEPDVESIDVFADPAWRDARAYVLPIDQPDLRAATRFVNTLLDAGVEVHRATDAFEVNGLRYGAGSYVVRTDQAFRGHVMDMFEPQWHPDDIGPSKEPVRPYDAAGWTPALSMDVRFDRVLDAFDAPLAPVAGPAAMPPARATEGAGGWIANHADSGSFVAINRLLAAGARVSWLEEPWKSEDAAYPEGAVFVAAGAGVAERVGALAAELGVAFEGIAAAPDVPLRELHAPRLGVFDVYGGDIATGWTSWLLGAFEFPFEIVLAPDLHAGALRERFDVLVLHTGLPGSARRARAGGGETRRERGPAVSAEDLEKMVQSLPPFEDWSRAADGLVPLDVDKAVPALRAFVEEGGVLIGLGSQARALARLLEVGVEVVGDEAPRRDEEGKESKEGKESATNDGFFVPTSLLRGRVRQDHVLGYGVSPRVALVFNDNPILDVPEERAEIEVAARFAGEGLLASGWARGAEQLHGKPAAVCVRVGAGTVCLFAADVVYRAQPQGSFKMLFNAILGLPAPVSRR
jgi:hypothetical protein